jgi:hypothetical protein
VIPPGPPLPLSGSFIKTYHDGMTTGWGNDWGKDAVRRTMLGGSSGRIAVFVIAAAFLALGVYSGIVVLSVPAGIATAGAAWAVARAIYSDLAVRRMERRHRDDRS